MSVKRDTVELRKAMPLATGVLDYFADALLVVAEVSRVGNEQHHPGAPLHWDKSKSSDEADALMRHLLDRGKLDTDGLRHSGKVAWRALALLQRELDEEARAATGEAIEEAFGPQMVTYERRVLASTAVGGHSVVDMGCEECGAPVDPYGMWQGRPR